MATIHDLATQSEVFESGPSWLEFAPNNLFNLRCVMCEETQDTECANGSPLRSRRQDVLGETER